jgi:hypothetical protein
MSNTSIGIDCTNLGTEQTTLTQGECRQHTKRIVFKSDMHILRIEPMAQPHHTIT